MTNKTKHVLGWVMIVTVVLGILGAITLVSPIAGLFGLIMVISIVSVFIGGGLTTGAFDK